MDDNIKRHSGRPRVGSIVKRSASSVSSRSRVDDFEMLKGSLRKSCVTILNIYVALFFVDFKNNVLFSSWNYG